MRAAPMRERAMTVFDLSGGVKPPADLPGLPRRLLFGISVTPFADSYNEIVEQVLAAEEGGLDLVGIQDHPYQRRFLDTFLLMADLLARTKRLTFFPDVANLQLRHPAMLAKSAATLDVMSGGRFELGLGAGGFSRAVVGMGGPPRTASEAVDALEEALPIIRGALDGQAVVRAEGPHYPIPGYPPGPRALHRVEIWIGAYKPRGLRLIARHADGWVPSMGYMPPDEFRAAAAYLDEAAVAAGRDPRSIRKIYNISGTITGGARGEGPLDGPVDQWVETLASWHVDLGVDAFIYWPPDTSATGVERFAADIFTRVRDLVGAT
jgi:alkanesulfonate monooxygenase SsuD/methylene tetrahydromethanopterin reductase-like flavin-dependent oxidoreductase (luciferase family)